MTTRRGLLGSVAVLAVGGGASARTIQGALPWRPNAGEPPPPARPGAWQYFNPEEGAAIEAMVDRLIPADNLSPGGRDAGCAVFIDRQLAGPFGRFEGYYMQPPFADGLPTQGMQSDVTPAARYRTALAAIRQHCATAYAGKAFRDLPAAEQDKLLQALEKGELSPPGTRGFFTLLLTNTMEGFFADPAYGGNRDMCSWKMLGFPGARYDLRDWLDKPNQRLDVPPVGIYGRPEWNMAGG